MIFTIDIVGSECHIVVYDNITDLTQRIEWQDIFEGQLTIIDEFGVEYDWDATRFNEIGTTYNYTLIPTSRVSNLVTQCLKMVSSNKNLREFRFRSGDI